MPWTRSRRTVAALAVHLVVTALVVTALASTAEANGAFPDSLSLMAPVDRPHEITLATNFGLISSEDDGQAWFWTCESQRSNLGALYQLGAPAQDRLFAVSSEGLVYSDDAACGWSVAGGLLASALVSDYFPDPGDPRRVFAIAVPGRDTMLAPYSLFESSDGGATFQTLRYAAPMGDVLTGVEVSRSDPRTIYVTGYHTGDLSPRLVQSVDGGITWHDQPIAAALGAVRSIRLIAIDPQKPMRLFLRVSGPLSSAPTDGGAALNGERLIVTDNAGLTVQTSLTLPDGELTSFVRMGSGTIVIAGMIGLDPVAWHSTDGGTTFVPLPSPPHIKALAARNTLLYASADNFIDDFAIGVSDDEGMTWRRLMTYPDVRAMKNCVHGTCRSTCLLLADMGVWASEMCDATEPTDGAPGGDGPTAAVDAAAADGGHAINAKAGCSCAAAPNRDSASSLWGFVTILALALAGTGMRRRARRP
jgi:hypothetical protein